MLGNLSAKMSKAQMSLALSFGLRITVLDMVDISTLYVVNVVFLHTQVVITVKYLTPVCRL